MARDPGYPSNTFEAGLLNSLFGGANASEFGQDAWTFTSGLAWSITNWLLRWKRKPYTVVVPIVQEDVAIGDVLAIDFTLTATNADGQTILYVRRYGTWTAAGTFLMLGVALEGATAGAQCHTAVGGALPANIFSGLTGQAAGATLTADTGTGKLRAWATGETVYAYVASNAAVFLLYPGRLA